jgi:hypothetical protein
MVSFAVSVKSTAAGWGVRDAWAMVHEMGNDSRDGQYFT